MTQHTAERDRLSREVSVLRAALEDIARGWKDGESFSGTGCAAIAKSALNQTQGE